MNKIFRTVWNHHRHQIVVVNENTTSHSQATGSTETSSVETFVAKTGKRLARTLLAAAVSGCFALSAQASWITDNGGKNGTLDWTVGTAGTTTWKTLRDQEVEILKGETLNVSSIGSNYTELTSYTLPNITAGNRIVNRGTYNIRWTGNKAQAAAENEGNFIDNYGTVSIVMNQTPNFGAENTQPNGVHNHTIAAWEIYKWNLDGSDAAWLKDKPAFYNRQGATFSVDINVDSTKLTSDKDAANFGSTITGLAINGAGDRSGMLGKNAGHVSVDIEHAAGARTYGLYLMEDGNSFVNEKTGVFDITTTHEKPAENFLDPALNSYAAGIKLGKATSLRNEGKFNINVTGDKAFGFAIGGADAGVAHLNNVAGAVMTVNATADSKDSKDYSLLLEIGSNDVIDNYGTIKGTALAKGIKAQGFGFNNADARLNNYAGSVLNITAKAVATAESDYQVHAKGLYADHGEQFINNGKATLSAIVDGAGTEKVTHGWAIDGRDAGTLVSNTDTLNLNYTGAMGGGLFLTSGAAFENSNATTITVTRPKDETVRTSLKGIYLDKTSQVTKAGGLKHGNNLVFETNSSLTLNDKFYNFDYVNGAKDALGANDKSMTVIFSGKLVDDFGNVRDETGIDSVPDGTVHEETDIAAKANTSGIVTIDKSVGGQTLVVDKGNKVALTDGKTLTLVGTDNASGELINFKDAKGDKIVTASGETGGITLGSESGMKKGTLSATVDLTQNATLTAQNGTFTVETVKAQSANIAVTGGELTVNKLDVAGTSAISSGVTGKTKVAELSVGKDGTTTVTGAVSADKIVAAGYAVINIGKIGTAEEGGMRGDLTIGEGSIKGLTFFLDPTWVDGQDVTDASRLVLNQTTVDGNVIVGENSYVVLGTNSDAEFVKLFQEGTLTWGNGEGRTLAAAYVAKPIDVTNGSLVVNGTLTEVQTNTVAGAVKFAQDAVLVADVSDLTADKVLIKGQMFDVDAASKAVIVGTLKNGETYRLTSDVTADFWNTEETLVAGNKLWDFTVNEDGSFTTKLADAAIVYGDLMQGHEIANAATESGNVYGNKLLTDTEGASPAAIAARFDAAMNTAGAAAVFTTAYDRASELRDAVRGEALEGEGNRLWAQVTGGKTKLNGLSSGAQSIHVDTDAYGLVVGGDVALSNGVLGAAFTAGTGDSENDDVGVKDDFDFYGLSVYGKTSVGGIDLLADGSMTFVKSDLTMGGVADVDTDTTTAVYSLGVQAQRTWDYVVAITPFVGMDIYHVRGDGYDNGHGAQVDDAHATAVEFPIGATIAKAFETNGFKLSPNFSFAVVPTVGDRDIDSKVRFAGAESTYNFTFADDVKVRTNLGFAAEKDNFRFGLNAGYDWGNEERSATKLMLNAQYRF